MIRWLRRAPTLAAVLVAGCTSSSHAVLVDAAAPVEPRVFVEAPPAAASVPFEDPEVPGIRAGDCPAEVSDYPEIFFNDRVLVRLPKPVTSLELIEARPGRASLTRPVVLPGCGLDGREVVLQSMTLELRDPDPGGRIELLRNDALSVRGVLGEAILLAAEVDDEGREADWVFSLPAREGREREMKLLVTIRRGGGALVIGMYEVAAEDWGMAVDSLRGSAERISILPP